MITDAVPLWRILALRDPRLWELVHPHTPRERLSAELREWLRQAGELVRVTCEQSLAAWSATGDDEALRPVRALASAIREQTWPDGWSRPSVLPADDDTWRRLQAQCALGLASYGAQAHGGPAKVLAEEVEGLAEAATRAPAGAGQPIVRTWELWRLVEPRQGLADELAPDWRDTLYPPQAWDGLIPHSGPSERWTRRLAAASTMDPIPVRPGAAWAALTATLDPVPFGERLRVEARLAVREAVRRTTVRAAQYVADGAASDAEKELEVLHSRVTETIPEAEHAARDAETGWRRGWESLDRYRETVRRFDPWPPPPHPWDTDGLAVTRPDDESLVEPLAVLAQAAVDCGYYASRARDDALREVLTAATDSFMVSALEVAGPR